MSYCLSIKVESGLVFAADTRTNAGVDHVNSYSKLHTFNLPGERSFVLLTAGNLATTQAVVGQVQRDIDEGHAHQNLATVDYVYDAADYIGKLSRRIQAEHRDGSGKKDAGFEASFILGGQIGGKPHDMYLIYPEGNCISASPTNPFLQIGETKYGKPILDRIIYPKTSLEDAARCALVSLDSTIRSNISVGPPIELLIYQRDSFDLSQRIILGVDTPFFIKLQQAWREGLNHAFEELPRFDWEE